MRKNHAFQMLSFLLMVSCLSAFSTAAENLIQNSSFESGTVNAPENWIRSNWAGRAEFLTVRGGHTGNTCAEIVLKEGGDVAPNQGIKDS